ncbi:UDP-glucosyltransferase 2-like [Galleria mellonella]|uniref:UDP-glucosyltransferase 2-like n=1 Tax=Galleria mellonella TaxID=7137 RepID=A0A6J3CF50_GALME|nr:UDP-glucosyltransferase 2-like [Galleria mellonella]
MKLLLAINVFLSSILITNAARILAVFVAPATSHQIVFRSLTLELARRGHELVVITPSPVFRKGQAPENYTEIDVTQKSREGWKKKPTPAGISKDSDAKVVLRNHIGVINKLFYEYLELEDVNEIIKDQNTKFDLLILEGWFRPSIAFAYKFDVPIIRFNSFGSGFSVYEDMGAFQHPVLNPNMFNPKPNDHTFWGRITTLYDNYIYTNMHKSKDNENDVLLRKHFGANIPSINELNMKVDILLVDVHRAWEMFIPTPPNLIHVGGIHINIERELPKVR